MTMLETGTLYDVWIRRYCPETLRASKPEMMIRGVYEAPNVRQPGSKRHEMLGDRSSFVVDVAEIRFSTSKGMKQLTPLRAYHSSQGDAYFRL